MATYVVVQTWVRHQNIEVEASNEDEALELAERGDSTKIGVEYEGNEYEYSLADDDLVARGSGLRA